MKGLWLSIKVLNESITKPSIQNLLSFPHIYHSLFCNKYFFITKNLKLAKL